MGQMRNIWKDRHIADFRYLNNLESYWASSRGGFGKGRVFRVNRSCAVVTTNLPWRSLADLFHFAGVPLERDEWLTGPVDPDDESGPQEWRREGK